MLLFLILLTPFTFFGQVKNTYCEECPMPSKEFNIKVQEAIDEGSPRSIAEDLVNSYHLSTNQIIRLINLFDWGSQKIAFAKYAYPRTFDQENFGRIEYTLRLNSEKEEFREWLNLQPINKTINKFIFIEDYLLEQKLIDLGYDSDKTINQMITKTDAEAIQQLDISNLGITNLSTINKFTNLTHLNCSHNSIISLDISSLKKLEWLNCSFNYRLTRLDCSNNIRLKYLNICNNQYAESEDVNRSPSFNDSQAQILGLENTKLEELNCNNVWIGHLDKNTFFDDNKTKLYIPYKTIKVLHCNLSNIRNLDRFSKLETLSCASLMNEHRLKAQNTSSHNLKKLYIDRLEQGTLKKLHHLTHLQIQSVDNDAFLADESTLNIKSLKNIQYLDVKNSYFKKIIFPTQCLLETLICSESRMQTINLTKTPKLKVLQCDNNQIETLNLTKTPLLKVLDCHNNQLTSLGLSNNTKLVNLNCSHNRIETINTIGLTALKTLDFSNNNISKWNREQHKELSVLSCEKNKLTQLDVSTLSQLNHLNCSHNSIATDINVVNNKQLKTLFIQHNDFFSITGINTLTKLHHLNCSHNKIKDLSIKQLKNLISLDCQHNEISQLNLHELGTNLRSINCANNNLQALSFSEHNIIDTLICDSNQLTSLDVSTLSILTYLQCSHNKIAQLLLGRINQIEALFCANNQLNELTLDYLIKIRVLDCSHNNLEKINLLYNLILNEVDCSNNKIEKAKIQIKAGSTSTSYSLNLTENPLTYVCIYSPESKVNSNNNNALGRIIAAIVLIPIAATADALAPLGKRPYKSATKSLMDGLSKQTEEDDSSKQTEEDASTTELGYYKTNQIGGFKLKQPFNVTITELLQDCNF